jgi:hypothetical protein
MIAQKLETQELMDQLLFCALYLDICTGIENKFLYFKNVSTLLQILKIFIFYKDYNLLNSLDLFYNLIFFNLKNH